MPKLMRKKTIRYGLTDPNYRKAWLTILGNKSIILNIKYKFITYAHSKGWKHNIFMLAKQEYFCSKLKLNFIVFKLILVSRT